MFLGMIIGFIAGMGIYTGVRTIVKGNKKMGIIQLIMTLISPIFISLWCMKKSSFVYGGTGWEFLIQTATIDKMIEPWLILILYIILIGLTIYNLIKNNESKK